MLCGQEIGGGRSDSMIHSRSGCEGCRGDLIKGSGMTLLVVGMFLTLVPSLSLTDRFEWHSYNSPWHYLGHF